MKHFFYFIFEDLGRCILEDSPDKLTETCAGNELEIDSFLQIFVSGVPGGLAVGLFSTCCVFVYVCVLTFLFLKMGGILEGAKIN